MCALGVIEQYLPRLAELVSLDVELGEEIGVVGYMEQRSEAHGAAVVSAAVLGARGPPLAFDVLDVAAPPAAGAVGPPHVLPEGGGHGLLARVGKGRKGRRRCIRDSTRRLWSKRGDSRSG